MRLRTARSPIAVAMLVSLLGLAMPSPARAQSALQFNGIAGSYVEFNTGLPSLGVANFTVETWFKRLGTGVTTSTGTGGVAALVPLVAKGAAEAENTTQDANYILGINTAGNVLAADFEENRSCTGGAGTCTTPPFGPGCVCVVNADCNSNVCAAGGLNHPLSGVTPIQNGVWYHGAVAYDGSTMRLYLNGHLEASLVMNKPTRNDSIQWVGLATTLNSTGVASGFFNGVLDEARIWNVARSQADIRATLNVENPSDVTLVARWGLNEGTGTAVGDSTIPAQNGTIHGTGAGTGWVAGATFDVVPCDTTSGPLNSLQFDGTNDYVTFGNPAELGLPAFTIET